jgi:hypothetical protein
MIFCSTRTARWIVLFVSRDRHPHIAVICTSDHEAVIFGRARDLEVEDDPASVGEDARQRARLSIDDFSQGHAVT